MRRARSGLGSVAGIVWLAWALGSCGPDRGSSTTRHADTPSTSEGSEGVGESVASLFELPFALTDANGHSRHLTDLRGSPFVATMIYTHCTSVCPRVTADLQSLERALPEHDRARTRFVLFSLDPERDTPAAMRAFAAEHSLDTTRWTLLAAAPDDMRTLAAVLGVRFRPEAGGEIAHSAIIAIVDSGGIVRHRQIGIQDDVAPLVAALANAR